MEKLGKVGKRETRLQPNLEAGLSPMNENQCREFNPPRDGNRSPVR